MAKKFCRVARQNQAKFGIHIKIRFEAKSLNRIFTVLFYVGKLAAKHTLVSVDSVLIYNFSHL